MLKWVVISVSDANRSTAETGLLPTVETSLAWTFTAMFSPGPSLGSTMFQPITSGMKIEGMVEALLGEMYCRSTSPHGVTEVLTKNYHPGIHHDTR